MNAYIINEVAGLMYDGYDEGVLDLVLGDVIGENRVSKRDFGYPFPLPLSMRKTFQYLRY